MPKDIHIALDLDKTLAYHETDWKGTRIGHPIMPMVNHLRRWVGKGYKISIFTARVSHGPITNFLQRRMIRKFLKEHNFPAFPITATKHSYFSHFVDDRAVGVYPNSGNFYFRQMELQ